MRSSKLFTVFLLSVFTVIIIIVFVFWGIGPGTNPTQQILVEVEGQRIYLQQFWNTYDRIADSYRQTVKDEKAFKRLKLKEKVFHDLINERAALVIAQEEGITVSDDAVIEAIKSKSMFHKDGHFDKKTYERLLKANRLTPKDYEATIRQTLVLEKFKHLVGETVHLSENELKTLESMKEQKEQMKEFMLLNKRDNALDVYLENIRPTLDIKINSTLFENNIKK